jgi:iron complex outermembrane receptor protein
MKRPEKFAGLLASAAGLSALSPLVIAQEQQRQQQEQVAVIEEIVVTSTQRERSVQDIPVSVNLITAQELEMAGVTDVEGLSQLAPTFYMTTTTSETIGATARIRGIGTQGNNPGLESAVGIFIDGVYRNRTAVGFTDLGQIERIELLRGPQGTLFGRNTSAGLVNVITKRPDFEETDAYLELSAGNFSYLKAAGGYSTGTESLAAGIDFTYTERDGFFDDQVTGDDYNTRDRYGLRGQVLYEPTDELDIRLLVDYSERDESCCAAVYTQKGLRTTFALDALSPAQLTSDAGDEFDRESFTTPGRSYDTEVDEYGLSGEVNWDITGLPVVDVATLTSITAYRDWEAANASDLDFSAADILYRETDDFVQHFQTFSQEFRLNGQLNEGAIDWLVGLYYSDEELELDQATKVGSDYQPFVENLFGLFAGLAPNPIPLPFGTTVGEGANDQFTTNTETLALFTHNTWRPFQELELTLGLRWTDEEKELDAVIDTIGNTCQTTLAAGGFTGTDGPFTPFLGGSVPLTGAAFALYCLGGVLNSTLDGVYTDTREEDQLSGTVAASYYLTDETMVFASYANGYKSGGFNLDRSGLDPNTVLADQPGFFDIDTDVNALEFDEETVDAYELGVKTSFGGGAAILNATYFYQDFENFQLNTFNGLTFFVVTLDEVISEGIEVDFKSTITDNLSVNAGLMWNEAEYADDVRRSDREPTDNLAGEQLTHAPEWSATGGITYDFDFGGLGAFAHLDFRYVDDHNTGSDLDEEKHQDSFTIFNARVGILGADETWSAELWAQNLFDEDYFQVVFDTPVQNSAGNQPLESYSAFLGEPRTWGVTLEYNF